MVRRVIVATLCALGVGPVVAAEAQAPRLFTIAGTAPGIAPPDDPRAGAVASGAAIGFGAEAVAATPDGGFAFTTLEEVWAMRASGRLERLARPSPHSTPS